MQQEQSLAEAGYAIRNYELTLVDPTYHFSSWSVEKRKLILTKKFPPDFRGYPCGTMLKENIKLDFDPDEETVVEVNLEGDKAHVKMLIKKGSEPLNTTTGPICMNVS